MFNQNNEEKKLDWMYKGPNSLVEREEYLLGRSVDKTLEQINEEEKQKQQGLIAPPKNRVEHECIPPSIRDFNKVVQAEQVDLSAKLQEDPLVAIKKREEESRRQFLQNPVQLKKLQKALKAQQAKKNKKKKKKKSKHSDDPDSDLDVKLTEKLLGKKGKKLSKEERDLDTILIHKYEEFKDYLTEKDLQDILNGKVSDSDDSIEDEKLRRKPTSKKHYSSSNNESEEDSKNKYNRRERRGNEFSDNNFKRRQNREPERSNKHSSRDDKKEHTSRHRNRSRSPENKSRDKYKPRRDYSSDSSDKSYNPRNDDSDDSDSQKKKKVNYGLVTSEGKKIPFNKKHDSDKRDDKTKINKAPEPPPVQRHKAKRMTEEEKEKLRQEMMENAILRDKERTHNVKRYREKEEKERKEQDFDPEFIHKQLMKSAHTSSVESRIKANLNNIQRSTRDMDKHFSRRH